MMSTYIIDRRGQSDKHTGNVERLKRRHKQQIQEAVERSLKGADIKKGVQSEKAYIPQKDLSQPVFRHAQKGGRREIVHPGNREYYEGDRFKRPQGGQGGVGNGSGSAGGEGEDDFSFVLSKEEIMSILFDDMALPDMIKLHLSADENRFKFKRAGIVSDGNPSNLHIVRSFRQSLARRIALDAPHKRELSELQKQFELAVDSEERQKLQLRIDELKARKGAPFLDPIDLRYRSSIKVPEPRTKAVMFCLMDVSGSMKEKEKEIAKLAFIFEHLFLERHYQNVELVMIRYHASARECTDANDFIYARETGGTSVASALELMAQIIEDRYHPSEWNIYGTLASDGDTGTRDDVLVPQLMKDKILPACQYFAYMEIAGKVKELTELFADHLAGHKNFAQRRVEERKDIFPVFKDLFKRKGVEVSALSRLESSTVHTVVAQP